MRRLITCVHVAIVIWRVSVTLLCLPADLERKYDTVSILAGSYIGRTLRYQADLCVDKTIERWEKPGLLIQAIFR